MSLWALGHHPAVGGHSLGITGPAAWLTALLPVLGGLVNWYRAAGLALVFVAAGASVGARALGRWSLLFLPLLWVDATVLSDAPWPRSAYDPAAPAGLLAIPGDGPLVLLPFDNGRRPWPAGVPRANAVGFSLVGPHSVRIYQ